MVVSPGSKLRKRYVELFQSILSLVSYYDKRSLFYFFVCGVFLSHPETGHYTQFDAKIEKPGFSRNGTSLQRSFVICDVGFTND